MIRKLVLPPPFLLLFLLLVYFSAFCKRRVLEKPGRAEPPVPGSVALYLCIFVIYSLFVFF